MNVAPECVLCFFEQALRLLQTVKASKKDQFKILVQVAAYLTQIKSFEDTPCHYTSYIYQLIYQIIGVKDPYRILKVRYNQLILKHFKKLKSQIQQASDPLKEALRLSAFGNIIDFGITSSVLIDQELKQPFQVKLNLDDFGRFKELLPSSKKVLFLADNAGEIVFDLLFIEAIHYFYPLNFSLAVKGGPVINDMTLTDMKKIKVPSWIKIISNGNQKVGTILKYCSHDFMAEFDSADIILSKGQANFETLDMIKDKTIFFLFKVKCDVVAQYLHLKRGDFVFLSSKKGRASSL